MVEWPEWWSWEIELTSHVRKRMLDRAFSETDLRLMLEDATGYHEEEAPGRWAIETIRDKRRWEVIVEPLPDEQVLLVITAYSTE